MADVGDVMMMVDGKWVMVGHTSGIDFVQETDAESILDTETTTMTTWGGTTTLTWTNPAYAGVDEIIDEKTGGHMAKKVSAHADPKFTDGVWICSVCESESMDKQMFEEAGEWEECAKNHARVATGEEKDALGRYVAGAEAKQNLDRATAAIKQFRDSMQKLGLAAADLNMVMNVMAGDFKGVTPEDVNRLTKKFPELKPALSAVKFPKEVTEELKPLKDRQWHKNLMRELNAYYSWGYEPHGNFYYFCEDVYDFWCDVASDAKDVLLYTILRRR